MGLKIFLMHVDYYCNSKYRKDADQLVVYFHDLMARHEINISDYYMRRNYFITVANRSRYIMKNNSPSSSIIRSLSLLAKSYEILELNDLFEDVVILSEANCHRVHELINIKNTEEE